MQVKINVSLQGNYYNKKTLNNYKAKHFSFYGTRFFFKVTRKLKGIRIDWKRYQYRLEKVLEYIGKGIRID